MSEFEFASADYNSEEHKLPSQRDDMPRRIDWDEPSSETGVLLVEPEAIVEAPQPVPTTELERRRKLDVQVHEQMAESLVITDAAVEVVQQTGEFVRQQVEKLYGSAERRYENRTEAINDMAEALVEAIYEQRDSAIEFEELERESLQAKADRMLADFVEFNRQVDLAVADIKDKIVGGENFQTQYQNLRERLTTHFELKAARLLRLNEDLIKANARIEKYTGKIKDSEVLLREAIDSHSRYVLLEDATRAELAQQAYEQPTQFQELGGAISSTGLEIVKTLQEKKKDEIDPAILKRALQLLKPQVTSGKLGTIQAKIGFAEVDRVNHDDARKLHISRKTTAETSRVNTMNEQSKVRLNMLQTSESILSLITRFEGQLTNHGDRMMAQSHNLHNVVSGKVSPFFKEEVYDTIQGVKKAYVILQESIKMNDPAEIDEDWQVIISEPANMVLPSELVGKYLPLDEHVGQIAQRKEDHMERVKELDTQIEQVKSMFNIQDIVANVARKGILKAGVVARWRNKAEATNEE